MIEVYKEKFAGDKLAPNGSDPDASHVKGQVPRLPEDTCLKTAEVLAWEEDVKVQGDIVRELKALKSTKFAEDHAEIAKTVDGLKKLKAELASYQRKAEAEAVVVAN